MMRRPHRFTLAMALTLAALAACDRRAASGSPASRAADSAVIRASIERGARGFMRAQPDSILAHYARDIVLSYPGIPDQDHATLAAGYAELRNRPASTSATTTPTFDEILVSGDLAIVRVRWTTTIRDAATSTSPARASTRYLRDLQVWRREADGAWKFIRGMHYRDSTAAPGGVRPVATAAVGARLVDSVPYSNELTDGILHRVEVRAAGRVDTVPGVLTAATPVVVGDTVVYGLRASENTIAGLFAYQVRSRQVRELPPPPGMVPIASPAVSPDGRHVAYLAQGADGRGYGAVATLPERRVIFRGPPATMLETDAGIDGVRWASADSFEIGIALSHGSGGGTQRVRGSVAPVRAAVDTTRRAPSTEGPR